MSSPDNEQPSIRISMDDPRYRIEGTDWINFSKWSRENIPKGDHAFKVGDVVTLTVTVEVLSLQRDCDGTPLYELSRVGSGWGEEALRPATAAEKAAY